MSRLRICHVINNLEMGGAEMMLAKLVEALPPEKYETSVVSLWQAGEPGRRVEAAGVPVVQLNCPKMWQQPIALSRLRKHLRQFRPHLVQSWMYRANLIASLACRGRTVAAPCVWNIRTSVVNKELAFSQRALAKTGAWWSRRSPRHIVVNCESGRDFHTAFGYDASRMSVIPNSFNLEAFSPCPNSREQIRRELGIGSDATVIGMVGNFHMLKGYQFLVDAGRRLVAEMDGLHFVACGREINSQNNLLRGWIESAGLTPHFHLLGERNDIPRVMNSFDVAVNASTLEGFANVIGEAMAVGAPCVVTDVGDSARIVGDTGVVVKPGCGESLTKGIRSLLALPDQQRAKLGRNARERVENNYSTPRIVAAYEEVWRAAMANEKPVLDFATSGSISKAA